MDLRSDLERLDRVVDRLVRDRERGVVAVYKEGLKEIKNKVAGFYEKYGVGGELRYEDMAKYGRRESLEKELRAEISRLHRRAKGRMDTAFKSVFEESYFRTGWAIERSTDRRIIGVIKDEVLEAVIDNDISGLRWAQRLGRNRDELVIQINEQVGQGLVRGESYSQMSARLQERIEVSEGKARTIIRTESHRVQEEAKTRCLDQASEEGVEMVKVWLTSADERVRSKHAKMHEEEVPYDDDFTMPDGAQGPYPGQIGEAHHDINCRCIYSVRITGVKEVKESPTVKDITSFKEWKEKRMDAA